MTIYFKIELMVIKMEEWDKGFEDWSDTQIYIYQMKQVRTLVCSVHRP